MANAMRATRPSRFWQQIGRLSSRPRLYSTSTQFDYDLIILGCGPAGFAAASRAWDLGLKVWAKAVACAPTCVIERQWLGGAAVWDGALASKTMWQLSRRSKGFKELLLSTNSGLDYKGSYTDVVRLTSDAEKAKAVQLEIQLEALAKGSFTDFFGEKFGGKVDLICGMAEFCDTNTVRVISDGGLLHGSKHARSPLGIRDLSARHFLIATGSRPRQIPAYPADGKRIMTSDHIMRADHIPASLAIIGAGVIGCEFAAIMANFGQTRVHLVNERRARLLPSEDEDLSAFITEAYKDNGVIIHNKCKLQSLAVRQHEVEVQVGDLQDDGSVVSREPFTVESVLFSVGRVPNTEALNLQSVGVQLKKNGAVECNEHLQSVTAPHIYCAGDSTFSVGLVSVAEMEGRYAVEHMAGDASQMKTKLSYNNVSSIMFLKPEVACVGMNEQEARRMNIPHRVGVIGYDITNRGIINRPQHAAEYYEHPSSEDMTGPKSQERRRHTGASRLERSGFVKMIVADDDENPTLLGMRVAGEGASAVIEAASLLICEKSPCTRLESVLHPHPSVTEAVLECTRMLMRRSIYKPHVFSSCWIRRYRPGVDGAPVISDTGPMPLVPSYGVDEQDILEAEAA